MAIHRQYAGESRIRNLTTKTCRVYCSTGGFVTFPPVLYHRSDPDDTLYIVSTGGRDWLIEHGVDESRLFFADPQGLGLDGRLVWALYPYLHSKPRLIPHREP